MKSSSRRFVFLIASLALAVFQGCATRLEMGSPPPLERMAQLTPQRSTMNDVLLALGQPRGYGAARLDPSFNQQHVWFYEHSVSEGKDVRFTMLLIFFSGNVYDGHMWFADAVNLQEYSGAKRP